MAQSTQITELSMNGYCFYGESRPGTTLDLIPPGNPSGNSMRQIFPVSYGFHNKSSAKTFDALMDFQYTPYPVSDTGGNLGYVVSTVHNRFFVPAEDIAKYGPIFNPRDESAEHMDRWIGATVGNHGIEGVVVPKFESIVVSRHERQPDPVMRKFVTDFSYEGPLNELGKYLSKAETLRQDWNSYFNGKEGETLAREKSGTDTHIHHIGVISIEGVIYAVGRLPNGEVALFTGDKAYDILSTEADAAKVRLEDRRIAALGEEAMHHYRKSYGKVKNLAQLVEEETETKAELLDFYERLAAGAESKPQLREKYSKIARHIKHDIATVGERYKNFWKKTHGNDELGNLECLVADAYANGCETEEEVSAYVASMLKSESGGENGNRGDAKSVKKSGKAAREKEPEEKIAYAAAEAEQTQGSEQAETANQGESGNPEPDSGAAESN